MSTSCCGLGWFSCVPQADGEVHQLVAGVGADDVLGSQLLGHLLRKARRQAAVTVDLCQLPQLPALRLEACVRRHRECQASRNTAPALVVSSLLW